MQPLNYTTKAIADLMSFPCDNAPATRAGLRYLAEKLRQAEVFILGDSGQLLDRSKPRPEVAGLTFRPPFPIVALEYTAAAQEWDMGEYSASPSSRRIALAWDWQGDLPAALANWAPKNFEPGVVVASIPFYDQEGLWMPVMAGVFLPYDGEYIKPVGADKYRAAMLASGRINPKLAHARAYGTSLIALMPEALAGMVMSKGISGMEDHLHADLMDEVNAYTDLCMALACKNVSSGRHPAPVKLNRNRIKAGKPPLKDFHVLEINGSASMPGSIDGSHASPRSHLRRGHIRRLDAQRITWVNSTIVRGRGDFVGKAYSIGGARA